jgi:hypothetical protein
MMLCAQAQEGENTPTILENHTAATEQKLMND